MKQVIRFLTQHFYPDTSSTGNLLTELAVGLAEREYNIEVFTFRPQHISSKEITVPKKEIYKNIKIVRTSSLKFGKNSKIGKAYNYFSYFTKTFFKVLFSSHTKNKYLYFIVSNPPFLPLIGSVLTYLKKIEFIHLLYDVQPEEAIAVGYMSGSGLLAKLWIWASKFIYKKAAHTIVLSEQMEDTVKEKMLVAKADSSKYKQITIIDNWADGKFLKPISYDENPFIIENNLQGKFIINYSGNIGVFQKFESIMKCAEILDSDNFAFIFVGDGVKKQNMIKEKTEKNLNNVYFFPYQDRKILPYIQAASHLSIVHLEKEIEGYAFPSKLYSVLASGTPVLALCQAHSRLAKIIREAECGYVKQHENIYSIADAINSLRNNPDKVIEFGRNARKYFEDNYTLEKACDKYEVIFNKFIK